MNAGLVFNGFIDKEIDEQIEMVGIVRDELMDGLEDGCQCIAIMLFNTNIPV